MASTSSSFVGFVLAGLMPTLGACTSYPLEQPIPAPVSQINQRRIVNATHGVDILFMVDNSLSMEQEQENLARNFPAFMRQLENLAGGLPDVHLAVVTSDVGAGGATVRNCMGVGDGGNFQVNRPKTSMNCGLTDGARFIVALDGGTVTNLQPGRNLTDVFSCMAERGVGACGFEHQLEAVRLALYPQPGINPLNEGFLRRDANLAIILITDEDDCSAPANAGALFMDDIAGQTTSYRCAALGHVCGGHGPPANGNFSAALDSCQSNESGQLLAVQEIVEQIKALKPGHPERIIVSAIAGWPVDGKTATAAYRAGPSGANPPQQDLSPLCSSNNGEATPAIRIHEFVSAFGGGSGMYSICQNDFSGALAAIGRAVAEPPPPCIEAALVDVDPAPGLQPDCVVSLQRQESGRTTETSVPACAPGVATPCWRLVAHNECTLSHMKYEIDRGGGTAAPDTIEVVKCQVCTEGTSGNCASP